MISTDALPDRKTLHQDAVAKHRKNRRRLLLALAVILPLTSLLWFVLAGEDWSLGTAAVVVGIPVFVILLILVVVVPIWRRQEGNLPLSLGTDRDTRRAVARALRDGGTTDPRIDALARDAAEHGRRQTWLIWLFGTGAALQAAGIALRITDDDRDWLGIAAPSLLMVLLALQMFTMHRNRRRSIRYLEGAPHGHQA